MMATFIQSASPVTDTQINSERSSQATGGFVTSASLLQRACGQDADAWKRLIHLYGPLVLHWCRQSGFASQDSDDICQDVFLAVVNQLDQFRHDRPGDTFRGWLRVIAQRRIADHFRRRADRPQAEGGTTALVRLYAATDPLADDPDAESEEISVTHRALELIRAEFEPKTWTAFRLTALEAKTPADVATELNMTTPAIRMAKSRVLSRLRQELAGLVSLDLA